MKSSYRLACLTLLAGCCSASVAALDLPPSKALRNWPSWRGPVGTGVAPTANPPVSWSETNGVKWKVAIPGSGNASPVGAGDRVYVAGRNGAVWVLKNGPALEVLARNKLDDGFDASPALVGNEIFLRGKEHLYAIANP